MKTRGMKGKRTIPFAYDIIIYTENLANPEATSINQ